MSPVGMCMCMCMRCDIYVCLSGVCFPDSAVGILWGFCGWRIMRYHSYSHNPPLLCSPPLPSPFASPRNTLYGSLDTSLHLSLHLSRLLAAPRSSARRVCASTPSRSIPGLGFSAGTPHLTPQPYALHTHTHSLPPQWQPLQCLSSTTPTPARTATRTRIHRPHHRRRRRRHRPLQPPPRSRRCLPASTTSTPPPRGSAPTTTPPSTAAADAAPLTSAATGPRTCSLSVCKPPLPPLFFSLPSFFSHPLPPPDVHSGGHLSRAEFDVLADVFRAATASATAHGVALHSHLTSELGAELPLHLSLSRPNVLATAQREAFVELLEERVEKARIAPFVFPPPPPPL